MSRFLRAAPHPWVIVFVGFAALALSFTFRAIVGVAMPSWETSLGWTRDAIASRGAIGLLVMAVLFPLVGAVVDRIGVRLVLTLGCAFLAAGMGLIGTMTAPWHLGLAYGLLGGIGFTLVGNTVVSVMIARSFSAQQGLATGIATSGSTAGQLVLLPVLTLAFGAIGWRATFGLIAVSCIGLGVLAFVLLRGEGNAARTNAGGTGSTLLGSFRIFVRDPGFHALAASFFVCGLTTTGIIEAHFIPYATTCGFAPLPSAIAYSVLAGTNFIGMMLAGWACDRYDRSHILALIYGTRGLTFFILPLVGDDYALLLLFAVSYGIAQYATLPATAGLAAARYGVGNLGKAMGFLMTAHSLGAALGVWVGGWVFVNFGSYDGAWVGCALAAIVAAGIALLARDPRHRPPRTGGAPLPAGA